MIITNTWCPLPWLHQFVQIDGIKPCCVSRQKENTLPSNFFQSNLVNGIKTAIDNNQIHTNCQDCFELEKQGFQSLRQESIDFYKCYSPDNKPNQGLEYLDLRYNNLCNYSCRTCEPTFSTSIVNEISQNNVLKQFYNFSPKVNAFDKISNDLFSLLNNIKRINFTGGEPLLIKDNLKILKKLIELNNVHCEILITTNASVINKEWSEILKNFSKVHWTISIDGVENFAEYIRHGTIWKNVKNNIDYILTQGHSVSFNTVISAYSVLNLYSLVLYLVKQKNENQGPIDLLFHLCKYPQHFSPAVLDNNLSKIAQQQIIKTQELIEVTDFDSKKAAIQILQNTLNILNTSNSSDRNKFITLTKHLDKIRNQSFDALLNKG